MNRRKPISTLHRFHPAAFNPLEVAEPVSEAFTKAPKSRKLVRRETQIRRDDDTRSKSFSITLYDIDFAIKRYIESTIKKEDILWLMNKKRLLIEKKLN